MTIKEAQELVDRWIREYGVRYFSELTNMAVLTEEVGELARIISRRYGDQSWKAGDPRSEDNGKSNFICNFNSHCTYSIILKK